MEQVTLLHGDALEVLRTLPDNSVDAIVTDPPAGIGFMGKQWDTDHGGRDNWIAAFAEIARECLRVVKPGAHALVWAIPRTSHWTATAWENGGWEVRDRVAHVFGSGFPKSKNVGNGWGSALKPAMEDWWLLRKPLTGTIAANVMQWGTGALNIDACRISTNGETISAGTANSIRRGTFDEHEGYKRPWKENDPELYASRLDAAIERANTLGRWPAHLIHDGSDEVVAMFPQTTSGTYRPPVSRLRNNGIGLGTTDERHGTSNAPDNYGDTGSAARFYYVAKASKRDRDEGLEGFEAQASSVNLRQQGGLPKADKEYQVRNTHPCVKNTELMRYLCRLITPVGGVVLDPFCGSGSTGKGAVLEGFSFIGIEREADYIDIARARIAWAQRQQPALIGDE